VLWLPVAYYRGIGAFPFGAQACWGLHFTGWACGAGTAHGTTGWQVGMHCGTGGWHI